MKKFVKFLNSNKFMLMLTFIINVIIFAVCVFFLGIYFYGIFLILTIIVAVGLLSRNDESSTYKLTWMCVILVLPLFGIALYLELKARIGTKKQRKAWQSISFESSKNLEQNSEVLECLNKYDDVAHNASKFILNSENMPVYQNTTTQYFNCGEKFFDDLFRELKNAKKFILVEYFIYKPGTIWETMFNILRLKAREGVEVKMIYDDFGCVDRFDDKKYFKKLINHGIEAVAFNKIKPSINLFVNYRDHRKICVIDGKIGYCGGLNIADEYANVKKVFGYWKDTAIKVSGDAVWNQTILFFNNWQVATKKTVDITKYKVSIEEKPKTKEFVQPYGTGPLNKEPVARNIYMKMFANSRKYIYISTPYFIIDQEMQNIIKLASLSGVDVRIIMPGIPDKRWVYYLSRSYYEDLIKAGVKIYEYTPGFVHAKMVVSDDTSAIVGSTNFDFRSLFLHYESGVLIHNSRTVNAIYNDFESMMLSSHLVSLRDVKQRKWYEKFSAMFLKFFAPLM